MNTNILTSFRFFAAFIVVILHYGNSTGFANLAKNFLTSGSQMVTFFFVLSGFVMTITYFNKPVFSIGDYFSSRIARIVPVYFLALFMSAGMFYSPEHWRDNTVGLFLNIVLLQSWFPPYPLSINMPAWSLSIEMFFYLVFPVVLIFLKKVNPKISIVFLSAMATYFITQFTLINLLNSSFYENFPSPSHDLIFYFPLSHFCSFLLGVSGAYFVLKSHIFNKFSNKIFWSVGFAICLVVVFLLLNNRGLTRTIGGNLIPLESSFLGPIFLVLILFSVSGHNILNKAFCLKPMIILGEASYAIYILQKPCFYLYKKFLWPLLGIGNDATYYVYWLLLVVVSVVVFYVYERPAKKVILGSWDYMKKSINKRACPEEVLPAPN